MTAIANIAALCSQESCQSPACYLKRTNEALDIGYWLIQQADKRPDTIRVPIDPLGLLPTTSETSPWIPEPDALFERAVHCSEYCRGEVVLSGIHSSEIHHYALSGTWSNEYIIAATGEVFFPTGCDFTGKLMRKACRAKSTLA